MGGLEILFWIWILTWMTKTAATDVIYSLRGETPPRHKARLARIERGEDTQRYGVGGWFGDLKSDALRAHTEKRRARSAEKTKADAKPVDDMVDVVGVRDNRRPPGSKPSPRPRPIPEAPTLEMVPDDEERDADRPGFVSGEDYCQRHRMPRMRQGVWGSRGVKYCPCSPHVEFEPPEVPADDLADVLGHHNGSKPGVNGEIPAAPTGSTNGHKPVPECCGQPMALSTEDGEARWHCDKCQWWHGKPQTASGDNQPTNPTGTDPAGPTKENDMAAPSGETTHILATRRYFTELDGHVRKEILPGLEKCAATLAGKNMDPEVVGKIHAAREKFTSALAGLADALATHDAKNKLMEQGVNNTARPAETDYYRHR